MNRLRCDDREIQARDGTVYCCAILDCFSRMTVARTFSTTADTALVNNAVNMAVDKRTRSGPTILHADHGTQFTSWSFGENMRRWGLLGSFGTVGDCFDNAATESFWGRMQVGLLNTRRWATTIELAAAMGARLRGKTPRASRVVERLRKGLPLMIVMAEHGYMNDLGGTLRGVRLLG